MNITQIELNLEPPVEEDKSCTFTCPDGRCVWQYDFMGSPICSCNEGSKYDKEKSMCITECSFECPDGRCVWQYDFLGMPKCSCKDPLDTVYNKETKMCEIGSSDSDLKFFIKMILVEAMEPTTTTDSSFWSTTESATVFGIDSEMRGVNPGEPKSEPVGERCGIKTCPIGLKCTSFFWGTCE